MGKESHERMPPTWDNNTEFFFYEIGCIYEGCFFWRCDPTRVMAFSFLRLLDHTQRRTTVGRTPLDEWSARRRDLYLTTHNTHNRQTSMPPVGFEPMISAGERPQTYALDCAATGTGDYFFLVRQNIQLAMLLLLLPTRSRITYIKIWSKIDSTV